MRVLSHVKEAHGLNDLQFEAVSAALTNALSVVTGGPGTGKTRTITAIIDAYKKLCLDIGQMPRILLIAPTGKAADRAHESTGHEASTRSEEHTSELQSLMRISYAVFCLKKKQRHNPEEHNTPTTKNIKKD